MLIGLVADTIEKLAEEFKEANPEEKKRFIKSSVNLLKTITEEL